MKATSLPFKTLSFFALLCLMTACDEDTPTASGDARFVLATTTGSFPSETSFLQTLNNLDISESVDNSLATEVSGPVSVIGSIGGHVYAGRFGSPAQLYKYSINDDHSLALEGTIQIDGSTTFSGMLIVHETEAYCLPYGIDEVILFNPETFQRTGSIDLSSLQEEGYTMLKSGMVKRDDKLYIPVSYTSQSEDPFQATFVAIVNLSDESVTRIQDDRTMDNAGNAFPTIALDEDENIYIQCKGAPDVLPGAVLRINADTDIFDAAYFFNLNEATGSTRVLGLACLQNNKAITAAQTIAEGNVYFDAIYSYYVIDVVSQTAVKIDNIPVNKAYRAGKSIMVEENIAVIPMGTDDENAVYSLDMGTVPYSAHQQFTAVDRIGHLLELD